MSRLLTILMMTLLLSANSSFADMAITPESLLEIQSQARVLHQDREELDSYLIALGKYRRSKSLWIPEEFRREAGTLQRITLELPEYYTEQEVYDHYKNQLPVDSLPLFECSSRGCGESNNWANVHFKVKQLYGQNASQLYGVYSWADSRDETKTNYLTLYTIRRGNDRLYTHLEVFWSK